MPGGIYDSSKTRVAPVFDALSKQSSSWVPKLLSLAEGSPNRFTDVGLNLTFQSGAWGSRETPIPPPVSLLSWMIRNPDRLRSSTSDLHDRQMLLRGEASATGKALDQLRAYASNRAWHIFEGPTVPDAYIETPDALVVVEGKRTEPGPTTDTTWLAGRHQIWRHIDAAWERRGQRRVFGLFVVEGESTSGAVPVVWRRAVDEALSPQAVSSSFPHRGPEERSAICASLLGVTTWQLVVRAFGLPASVLVERIGEA